ncbi:MAG: hypothetical protein ACYDCQ_01990 [Dehalococcoidia bacterium]
MISEYPAPQVLFAGLGAEGHTATEAAEQLAAALRQWCLAHEECRMLQLSVTPASPAAEGAGRGQSFGIMAIVAYVETGLTSADAAGAVAAALEEIHEAQVTDGERLPGESAGQASV